MSEILEEARLVVALDVRHPMSYLALAPTLEFAAHHDGCVDWLPVSVQGLKPPSDPGENEDRGTRHRRFRAQAIRREIDTYAGAQGLVMKEPYRTGAATGAHLAWLWVRESAPEKLPDFMKDLFRGYWSLSLSIATTTEVAPTIEQLGLDAAAFQEWTEGPGTRVANEIETQLREKGIFQSPAYLVEDELFFGRQHLPMIAWILGGRSGNGPI